MNKTKKDILDEYLDVIEEELKLAVNRAEINNVEQLYDMLMYHMGWKDETQRTMKKGKRIRPLLVLLTCSAAGGDWQDAIPAAIAVELVHNFSLIHDDIQDHSPLRRGRKTVWKKWGIAQAINAGDALFTLAHLQVLHLSEKISESATLRAIDVLQNACLQLTHGQYLDLAFEKRNDVNFDSYWSMAEGKTAALISACSELGAICAITDEKQSNSYCEFGRLFGLAFQAQDDLLGIWGEEHTTGKSIQSDLLAGKKTLPIIFGLLQEGEFARNWNHGCNTIEDAKILRNLLEAEGGKDFTISKISDLINQALDILNKLNTVGIYDQILRDFTSDVSTRRL